MRIDKFVDRKIKAEYSCDVSIGKLLYLRESVKVEGKNGIVLDTKLELDYMHINEEILYSSIMSYLTRNNINSLREDIRKFSKEIVSKSEASTIVYGRVYDMDINHNVNFNHSGYQYTVEDITLICTDNDDSIYYKTKSEFVRTNIKFNLNNVTNLLNMLGRINIESDKVDILEKYYSAVRKENRRRQMMYRKELNFQEKKEIMDEVERRNNKC